MLAYSKHDLITILRKSHFSFATLIEIVCATHKIGLIESIVCEIFGQ
jgi:hypothetical protein